MKESTKSKIDSMSMSELEADIANQRTSPFQNKEKRNYISQRLIELKQQESQLRHRENIEIQKSKADANKPNSPLINTWWSIFGVFILACLLYIFRKHLGVPL